jgi:hypothetical protein
MIKSRVQIISTIRWHSVSEFKRCYTCLFYELIDWTTMSLSNFFTMLIELELLSKNDIFIHSSKFPTSSSPALFQLPPTRTSLGALAALRSSRPPTTPSLEDATSQPLSVL